MATRGKRATSQKRQARETEKESDMEVQDIMLAEKVEEKIPTPEPQANKEEITLASLMEFMKKGHEQFEKKFEENRNLFEKKFKDSQEESKKMSENNHEELRKMSEKFDDSREELNKKLDSNQEELYHKIEENKVELQTSLQAQFEVHKEEICQQLNANNENWKFTQIEIQTVREEVQARIEDIEEQTTHKVEALRRENTEEREYVNGRITIINKDIGHINELIDHNKHNIDGIKKHDLAQMKEELEMIRNRPMHVTTGVMADNRETINYKNYKRNPMEFLARLNEYLQKQGETRWVSIRGLLDESFKEITDNWWTVTRHEINTYEEFQTHFKNKYWSESTQNIIRDNLCNGHYDPNRGQSPTAYFLGKVSLARNLEPRIPEECLVTKLSYHYDEGISRARLYGQINTIRAMEALLENYEHESYYRRNRKPRDYPTSNPNTIPINRENTRTNNRNNYNLGPRNMDNRNNNNYGNNNSRYNNNNNNYNNSYPNGRNDRNNNAAPQNNAYQRNGQYNDNRNYRPAVNFVQGRRTYRGRRNSWTHYENERYYNDRRRDSQGNNRRSRSNEDRRDSRSIEHIFVRHEGRENNENQELSPAIIQQNNPLNEQRQ